MELWRSNGAASTHLHLISGGSIKSGAMQTSVNTPIRTLCSTHGSPTGQITPDRASGSSPAPTATKYLRGLESVRYRS